MRFKYLAGAVKENYNVATGNKPKLDFDQGYYQIGGPAKGWYDDGRAGLDDEEEFPTKDQIKNEFMKEAGPETPFQTTQDGAYMGPGHRRQSSTSSSQGSQNNVRRFATPVKPSSKLKKEKERPEEVCLDPQIPYSHTKKSPANRTVGTTALVDVTDLEKDIEPPRRRQAPS